MPATIPGLSCQQRVEVDRLMAEAYGISQMQMKDNAGLRLAELARDLVGGPARRRRHGCRPPLEQLRSTAKRRSRRRPRCLRGPPAQPWHRLQAFGLTDGPPVGLGAPDRMLDALIGYGVPGSPGREPRRWIERALSTPAPILGLDTPSGLDVDADDAQPPTIRAAATFTTALPKVGLLLPQARPFVGELSLADVGVPPALYRDLGLQVGVLFAQGSILRHAEANSPRP